MRIFIDIGHPAHVHYFRNFIEIMTEMGHKFCLSARDKDVTINLLQKYKLDFYCRGKGGKGLLKKLLYIPKADFLIYRIARKFKPDLFLSFGSTYAAHVSKMLCKPHIAFDDTECAKFEHLMYAPFTNAILNPSCFYKKFSNKQIFFNGFMELTYLHPNYFCPDKSILTELNINDTEKYVLIRFVNWDANHDFGCKGLSLKSKIKLVASLSQYSKVFISSEKSLPVELEKYSLNISPEKMHHVIAFSSLFVGESATMASEAAILGVPAIYIDEIGRGYTKEEEEKYGLVFNYRFNGLEQNKFIEKATELIQKGQTEQQYRAIRDEMLSEKIDVTAFMVWFVENFPQSYRMMKENPDYQLKFK